MLNYLFNKKEFYTNYVIKNRYSKNPLKKNRAKQISASIGASISWNVVINDRVIFSHGINNIHLATFTFKGYTVIQQNVTIGDRGMQHKIGHSKGFLYIGAGAFVSSDITIGANVIIGANAVITKDVPANTVAIGANVFREDKNKVEEYKKWVQSIFANKKDSNGLLKTNRKITDSFVKQTNIIEKSRDKADLATTKIDYKNAINKYNEVDKRYKNITN